MSDICVVGKWVG